MREVALQVPQVVLPHRQIMHEVPSTGPPRGIDPLEVSGAALLEDEGVIAQ